jgi:hypothetical protein
MDGKTSVMYSKNMTAGAPFGNTNAEKWTHEVADVFFETALALAETKEEAGNPMYDFIGELASDMGYHKQIFAELAEKFDDLQAKRTRLLSRIEANCFRNTKKGKIKEATGIVNLKSNYGWRDRSDITTNDKDLTNISDAELTRRINAASQALEEKGIDGTSGGETA